MATQNQWLLTQEAGLRERDVAVVRIIGDVVTGPAGSSTDARAWRGAAAGPPGRFTVTLIGKDGTRAFEERRPIKAVELFRRIDAMPMRLEEMAHRTR